MKQVVVKIVAFLKLALFFVLLASISVSVIYAQTATPSAVTAQEALSYATARYLPIREKGVKDGDIVSSTLKGYIRSRIPSDPTMIGIISLKPAIVIDVFRQSDKTFPVVTQGIVLVNASNSAGTIKKNVIFLEPLLRILMVKKEVVSCVLLWISDILPLSYHSSHNSIIFLNYQLLPHMNNQSRFLNI